MSQESNQESYFLNSIFQRVRLLFEISINNVCNNFRR